MTTMPPTKRASRNTCAKKQFLLFLGDRRIPAGNAAHELGLERIAFMELGIYRMAKDRHLIRAAGPKLDGLRRAGFWLREDHYRMIPRSVGE